MDVVTANFPADGGFKQLYHYLQTVKNGKST